MQSSGEPATFQDTEPIPGQESFLYTYVLLREEKDGILGFLKVISTHGTPQDCINDYKRAEPTNKQCPMKWNETGKWVVIRRPETDTEGTIDIVKCGDEEGEADEFMGEKLVRENLKPTPAVEEIKDRASVDAYKTNVKVRMEEERRIKLRKQAMDELQTELDDPTSLASYAQLQWKRLTQKSAIDEYRSKLEEAQAALMKNIKELQTRKRSYPHYEAQWQNEIRRIQTLMAPKQEPQPFNVNSTEEDDADYAQRGVPDVEDEFDSGVGLELKTPKEPAAIEEMRADIKKTEDQINKSFLPEAPTKKIGGRRNRKNKRK